MIDDKEKWGVRVFVGRHSDAQEGRIVVSFRGTHVLRNWVTDLHYPKITGHPACAKAGCKVHVGFYNAWKAVQGDVVAEIRRLQTEHRGRYKTREAKVFVTGHSLGAAVARDSPPEASPIDPPAAAPTEAPAPTAPTLSSPAAALHETAATKVYAFGVGSKVLQHTPDT